MSGISEPESMKIKPYMKSLRCSQKEKESHSTTSFFKIKSIKTVGMTVKML